MRNEWLAEESCEPAEVQTWTQKLTGESLETMHGENRPLPSYLSDEPVGLQWRNNWPVDGVQDFEENYPSFKRNPWNNIPQTNEEEPKDVNM